MNVAQESSKFGKDKGYSINGKFVKKYEVFLQIYKLYIDKDCDFQMTNDYEVAIEEGQLWSVSDIFGADKSEGKV